jgi:hypothetical protein
MKSKNTNATSFSKFFQNILHAFVALAQNLNVKNSLPGITGI